LWPPSADANRIRHAICSVKFRWPLNLAGLRALDQFSRPFYIAIRYRNFKRRFRRRTKVPPSDGFEKFILIYLTPLNHPPALL